MTPEELIGPAAAKALAEHYDLTPKAKPLPEVVTKGEVKEFEAHWYRTPSPSNGEVISAFVLRWLRARLGQAAKNSANGMELPNNFIWSSTGRQAETAGDVFKVLTGREWTP